jgi:protein N-terminal methyltransferase
VLGGFGTVHEVDTRTSQKMISDFSHRLSGFNSAIDLGAGIGRISKVTLLPVFKEVDLVEPAVA